ncbi:acyltransferase family protein [Rhizobium miluonense]|uniref:Peptidoglycan/LPS O-acetylase OafA/YrhL, contains acyltransferase and SGNH-hydrolase domains n=1 Tax=Rhizobium miluonense TaxID=411945 RepID=A0A1C3WSU8_9HYPH|nr:acyltransferase [Rhizobium miluonense]SCB43030.1 Peptidoglycan/LPS O-acetylase OafA/YrhL, contains acyltransferase and SGNH-hydrolase domains [Rhizobium miluonense]
MNTITVASPKPLDPLDETTSLETAATTRALGPDILRALAILLVMLVHLPVEATPLPLAGIRPYGWIGVDIFFVLSGYLIGSQLMAEAARRRAIDFKAFYLRRAFRILPAFLLVLAFYTLVPSLRDAPTMQPAWRFFTFTVNFGLDPRLGGTFTEAWSLSVEEHFYLLLPVLVVLLRRRATVVFVASLVATIVIAGMGLRFALWQSQVGPAVEIQAYREALATYFRDVYYPTYNRLDGLTFGVVLAAIRLFKPLLWERYMPPYIALGIGSMSVIAALVIFSIRGPFAETNLPLVFQPLPGAVFGFPLFSAGVAFILGALVDLQPRIGRWHLPAISGIATLSYSLYLTHKGVYHLDQMVFGKDNLQGLSGFVIYLATCFIVAAALWFLVERNFLMLRDHLMSRSHRVG